MKELWQLQLLIWNVVCVAKAWSTVPWELYGNVVQKKYWNYVNEPHRCTNWQVPSPQNTGHCSLIWVSPTCCKNFTGTSTNAVFCSSQQDYAKTTQRISAKLGWRICLGPEQTPLTFWCGFRQRGRIQEFCNFNNCDFGCFPTFLFISQGIMAGSW